MYIMIVKYKSLIFEHCQLLNPFPYTGTPVLLQDSMYTVCIDQIMLLLFE